MQRSLKTVAVAVAAVTIISNLSFLPAAQAAVADAAVVRPLASASAAAAPIEQVACWGRGCGGPPVYGAPVYVVPGYYPPPVVVPAAPLYAAPTYYYCDKPRGYYPTVPSCTRGWRVVVAP